MRDSTETGRAVTVWGCLLGVLLAGSHLPAQEKLPFQVPDGFQVTLFAGDDLAHNIYSMTLDSTGRVVVAGQDSGGGYVKILYDDDSDGRADRAGLFSKVPASGAHGMYFDGPDLICTGDNALMRLRDSDGDGRADPGNPEIWATLRHSEHGANGIVKGPDGWFYVICGNDAGVTDQHAQGPGSPVSKPHMGAVVRFSPDGKISQVLAHGFRNPYDLDFNSWGSLFTVDADGERDHHLPWYAPNRLFDIAPGMHHGWVLAGWQRSWNRPQSYFDNVERVVEIGRGSPTGLTVYRHRQFPQRYRNGVFTLCWTFGRVYFCPLTPQGSSYKSSSEIFLQTTGNSGFAPVGVAVGPQGDLFVAIGGRQTQGSVFRVRYQPGHPVAPHQGDDLTQVLEADQPLESWSRAQWVPQAARLGREAFEKALLDPNRSQGQRLRAVEVLLESFGPLSPEVAHRAILSEPPAVSARIAWALGRGGSSPEAQFILENLTVHPDPRVQRCAWEGLGEWEKFQEEILVGSANWSVALASPDRRIRSAAILVARRNPAAHPGPGPANNPRRGMAEAWIGLEESPPHNEQSLLKGLEAAWSAFSQTPDPDVRLEAVRLIQIGLGDIHIEPKPSELDAGYTADGLEDVPEDLRAQLVRTLSPAFPTGDPELDRELARVLAMLHARSPSLLEAITSRWSKDSSCVDDIHYLLVMAQLPGPRPMKVTQGTAHCLAQLHGKMARENRQASRNWPRVVGEVFERLQSHDGALAQTLVKDPAFGDLGHALFMSHMKGPVRDQAAAGILAQAGQIPQDQAWPEEFLEWVRTLPADQLPPAVAHRLEAAKAPAVIPAANALDLEAWKKRLESANWSDADPVRGRLVYEARACATCHGVGGRLGPSLAGVGGRFSRADLFAHILEPDLAISPAYQAMQITTTDGQVYIGGAVYESPESTILETAPGVTVRIMADQVVRSEPARFSPMPRGLLEGATDRELADLYEYIKGLK